MGLMVYRTSVNHNGYSITLLSMFSMCFVCFCIERDRIFRLVTNKLGVYNCIFSHSDMYICSVHTSAIRRRQEREKCEAIQAASPSYVCDERGNSNTIYTYRYVCLYAFKAIYIWTDTDARTFVHVYNTYISIFSHGL